MSVIQILTALKTNMDFKVVPVVVLSAMPSPAAMGGLYAHQAACVIELPPDLDGIEAALRTIKDLWLHVARLPYGRGQDAS
jgi:two-component system, response regulator